MTTYQKTDDPGFVREPRTTAIINIDTKGFKRFKEERAQILKTQQLAKDVASLQSDMKDIKQLLQQLVNGK